MAARRESLEEVFGSILRRRRLDAGLSQEELAELAGFDRVAVSLWENGHRCPSLRSVVDLADAFGVPCATFLGELDRRRAAR